jgi:endonuclease/exonuclease/phosphatase family metal-dependent hydrolase
LLGDGLNRFSSSAFESYRRCTWRKRHGIFRHAGDALLPKGFAVATHRINSDLSVDVYNLHMDAGSSEKDYLAREAEIDQLSEVLTERSAGKAVIVAGDFNLKASRPNDLELLARFKEAFTLSDVREVLSLGSDRIDRILYRSGAGAEIEPIAYKVETGLFRDADGYPLSDHDAISAQLLFRPSAAD